MRVTATALDDHGRTLGDVPAGAQGLHVPEDTGQRFGVGRVAQDERRRSRQNAGRREAQKRPTSPWMTRALAWTFAVVRFARIA